jgi:hypothetical protein
MDKTEAKIGRSMKKCEIMRVVLQKQESGIRGQGSGVRGQGSGIKVQVFSDS